MTQYLLAIDQGTTGSTVLIVDESLKVIQKVNKEFPQIYPHDGWVEHNPEAIWNSVVEAIQRALAKSNINPHQIAAIGITNQRETTLLWEKKSGQPVGNAIVWQDRRTANICSQLKSASLEPLYRERTGLVLDPYFSGTKVKWMLDNNSEIRRKAETGQLAFGTVDSYLLWRLTGGAIHITDVSNASRTLLFNLHTLKWDPDLLKPLNIPEGILPEVRSSSEHYGNTKGVPGLPDGIPITGVAGDQQAALFGQTCFHAGEAKCTYGTGAFLLVNIGSSPLISQNGLLTTVAWKLKGQTVYALEGSAFIAGAAVQWLRDGLQLIASADDIETLANSVPNSGGVIFIPALVGLGAPHWHPHARGLIAGINRGTTAAHLARATLEGIALQIHDLAKAICSDWGHQLTSFKVDGGAAANNLLMQFQSDILNMNIIRPQIVETTALGAACLAGLGVGIWNSLDDLAHVWHFDRTFYPSMENATRQVHLKRWAKAVALASTPLDE